MFRMGVENKPGCFLGLVRALVKKDEEETLAETMGWSLTMYVRFPKGTLVENRKVTGDLAMINSQVTRGLASIGNDGLGLRLLPVIGFWETGKPVFGAEYIENADQLGKVFKPDRQLERRRLGL